MKTSQSSAQQAFVLGAGLGTRLRPLTEELPKPLIPVWNRSLITYAFDHLRSDLGVSRFMVNTHHCPDAYADAFPGSTYAGCQLSFRHEPLLLDTAGGIDNVRDWLPRDESFVVYNGDILTDIPLQKAWESHCKNGDAATLLLRSQGDELRVGWDEISGKVVDLRGQLDPEWPHRFQFTGIYILSPEFYQFIEPRKIESVVFAFLRAILSGARIGGVVIDEGRWSDLGERDSYLASSVMLASGGFPRYGTASGGMRIHPDANIHPTARICPQSSVAAAAVIEESAVVKESIIWSNARVSAAANVERCIVRTGRQAVGRCLNQDF